MSLRHGLFVSTLAVSACLSLPSSSIGGEMAHLILDSAPGSFIGGGKDWDITYTPQNSQSFFTEIVQTLPSGQPDSIRFILGTVTSGSNNTYAELDFSTVQLGTPLQPGTYDNAQRAAFADPGHPGLDVSFQNRGSNVLTGSFTINEVSFYTNQNNQLEIGSFSVSFSQSSDNNTSNITGTFTFQAQSVPEPASMMMLGLGTIGLAVAGYGRSRNKRSALRSRDSM
jgi:PEP-CTERM motif